MMIPPNEREFLGSSARMTFMAAHSYRIREEALVHGILKHLFELNTRILLITSKQKSNAILEYIQQFFDFVLPSGMLKRSIRSPYGQISLHNGSKLRCFEETRPGLACKGQYADFIYIFDIEDLSEKTFRGAIMPMMLTDPDCQLFATAAFGTLDKVDFLQKVLERDDVKVIW